MALTKQQTEGLVRHALTLVGAIILVFFADAENMVGEIVAAGAMLAGVIWSIATKSGGTLIEKIKGVSNHSIAILSAILIYFGKGDAVNTIELVVGTIINILPFLFSALDKNK